MELVFTGPDWLIRPCGDNFEIWLCGGCINSIDSLNEAEEFLRSMRPLMQAKEDARTQAASRAPLEWVDCVADTVFGSYWILADRPSGEITLDSSLLSGPRSQHFPTIEAAKAAAQANYETRINP